MRPSRQKQVLIALGRYDHRLHRGIEKYALEHDWHVSANLAREKVIPWGWEGHGILTWLGLDDEVADFVLAAKTPTVDFGFCRPQLRFPRILEDHAHAAQLVAEHFLKNGATRFLFYSDTDNWTSRERCQGFVRALARAGRSCTCLHLHEQSLLPFERKVHEGKRRRLEHELRNAAKPLAVFAANDQQALDVLEACERLGIAVPEQVAIVGAEDYLLAPDARPTPLSSVDTNLELLGYRGAELLDQMMDGRPAPAKPLRVPAAGVVARRSSDLFQIKHPGVVKSLHYIREHKHRPIFVRDLTNLARLSPRGLHKAFVEHLGRTPGKEIRRTRIELAKQLLAGSRHEIKAVGRLSGYKSLNSFYQTFKRATGTTPKRFRNADANRPCLLPDHKQK
jgi:LacI family transcriptional regulator